MTIGRRVSAILQIQPGEERLIGLLVLFYFVLAMAFVFVQSIAFGIFLAEYGAQELPYSYISIAILASLAAVLYIKTGEHVSFATLLTINVVFLGLLCLFAWWGLNSTFSHTIAFFLPLLFQVVANMGNLAAWTLAAHLLDFRQGKRLFPLVAAGLWLANTIGGVLVSPLVAWIGAVNLLLLAVVSLSLATLVLRHITGKYLHPEVQSRRRLRKNKKSESLFKNRYVILIFVYTVLWWVLFFYLDNIFSDRAAAQFPDVNQLTAFMGHLLSVTGIVALICTTFLAGPIINRFGVRGGLLGMPLLVTVVVAALAASGTFGGTLFVVFGVGAIAKLINVALGFSISQSAIAILFQSVPDPMRAQVHTMAEGVMQPIATGLAGISLLVLTAVLKFDYLGLTYVFLGLAVLWLAVIFLLSSGYVSALTQAITRRRFGESPEVLADPAAVAVLQSHLQDLHPGPAIYALTKLEQLAPEAVKNALPSLVSHPAAEVRREAFLRVERAKITSARDPVRNQLKVETDPAVREAGLRALASIADVETFTQLNELLEDTNPQESQGALVALLKYGGLRVAAPAQKIFDRLCNSPAARDRMLAAQILGLVGQPRFEEAHEKLLRDPEPAVRSEALRAAGKLRHPRLYPFIIEACDSPETSRAAIAAILAIGGNIIPAIEAAFSQPEANRHRQLTLARVLGRSGGKTAHRQLRSRIQTSDLELRSQILIALGEAGFHEPDISSIEKELKVEVSSVAQACAAQLDLGEADETELLRGALRHFATQARERVLLLLSFVFDSGSILSVREAFLTGSKAHLAYALEIIETQLSPEWRRMVMPVLEDLSPEDRSQRLKAVFPQPRQDKEDRLRTLINAPEGKPFTNWVKVCAIYAAGQLPARSCHEAIEAACEEPNALLKTTARWSLEQFMPERGKGNKAMLSTIEKVIILKTVRMFGQTPDEVLADVADLLEEEEVSEGEPILKRGDFGDSMYIIVDGKVRVHDSDRHINYLRERDVFGEMALLDAEPRMASVTAVEPTRLFRLEQGPFYELLAERPEIATGIIRVLTQRLRERIGLDA